MDRKVNVLQARRKLKPKEVISTPETQDGNAWDSALVWTATTVPAGQLQNKTLGGQTGANEQSIRDSGQEINHETLKSLGRRIKNLHGTQDRSESLDYSPVSLGANKRIARESWARSTEDENNFMEDNEPQAPSSSFEDDWEELPCFEPDEPKTNFARADRQFREGKAPPLRVRRDLPNDNMDRLKREGKGHLIPRAGAQFAFNGVSGKNQIGWIHPEYKTWQWFNVEDIVCLQCGIGVVPVEMRVKTAEGIINCLADSSRNQCIECSRLLKSDPTVKKRWPSEGANLDTETISEVSSVSGGMGISPGVLNRQKSAGGPPMTSSAQSRRESSGEGPQRRDLQKEFQPMTSSASWGEEGPIGEVQRGRSTQREHSGSISMIRRGEEPDTENLRHGEVSGSKKPSSTWEAIQMERRTFLDRPVTEDHPLHGLRSTAYGPASHRQPQLWAHPQLSDSEDLEEEESLDNDDQEPQRVHREIRSERVRQGLYSKGMAHLVTPLSMEDIGRMTARLLRRVEHEALESREAFLGLRREGSAQHMVEQTEEYLAKIIESPVASLKWKAKAGDMLDLVGVLGERAEREGTVFGRMGTRLAEMRAHAVRYGLICSRLSEVEEDAAWLKSALSLLENDCRLMGKDPQTRSSRDKDEDEDSRDGSQGSGSSQGSKWPPPPRKGPKASEIGGGQGTRGSEGRKTQRSGDHEVKSQRSASSKDSRGEPISPPRKKEVVSQDYHTVSRRHSVRPTSTPIVASDTESEGRYDSLREEEDEEQKEVKSSSQSVIGGEELSEEDAPEAVSRTPPSTPAIIRGNTSAATTPSIRELIEAAGGLDHRRFCQKLMQDGIRQKVEKELKSARTKAIKAQLDLETNKKELLEAIPLFQLLPTERRSAGEVKFKTLKAVGIGRDESVIEAFTIWLRAAEQSNLNRKEFFCLLSEGSTLADPLKSRYETWTHMDAFQSKEPQTPANDVLYWGRKILIWLAQFITLAGEVPELSVIMGRLTDIKVDRSSREKVDLAWTEFRSLYHHLPANLRTPPVQYEQWKFKMMAGDVLYGKKWIQRMSSILEKTRQDQWTDETLEAAFRSVSLYAQKPECTWPLDKSSSIKKYSAATYAEVLQTPAVPEKESSGPTGEPKTAEESNEPMGPGEDKVRFCHRCYGQHYNASLQPDRPCFNRAAKGKKGVYVNGSRTIGYNISSEMWFLGRPELTSKFWASLEKDVDYIAMPKAERTAFDGRIRELSSALTERWERRMRKSSTSYRGGGRGGPADRAVTPPTQSGEDPSLPNRAASPSRQDQPGVALEGAAENAGQNANPTALSAAQATVVESRWDSGSERAWMPYIAAQFPKALNKEDVREVGDDLTFATSRIVSERDQEGYCTILPVGVDPMSAVTTISRALVRRAGWREDLLPESEWIGMETGLSGGATAVLKSTVSLIHYFEGAGGKIRVTAKHHVVETPNFDILLGKATLRQWGTELTFGSHQETMTIGRRVAVPTYGVHDAIATVAKKADEKTRMSVIWRRLGVAAKCAAGFKMQDFRNVGLTVAPGGGWQVLRFKDSRDIPMGMEVLVHVVEDNTDRWKDPLDNRWKPCLDFAKVSYCKGRAEVWVRSLVSYPVEIGRGDVRVRVTPITTVESIVENDNCKEQKRVRFSLSTMAIPVDKLQAPPAIYPEELRYLWAATRAEARAALHRWSELEGADPVRQKAQLLEIAKGLDIYDSREARDVAPWGEVVRVPEAYLQELRPVASELGGGDPGTSSPRIFAAEAKGSTEMSSA